MKKIFLWILGIAAFLFVAVAAIGFYKFNILADDIYVQTQSGSIVKYNDIIQVTSSIIPLSSVVNTIGGDYVEVNNIVPAGVSPHGFDLSARKMAEVENSQIVFLV